MKEAVNDVFKLVKNEGNLIFNFENAVDKVASHHNVNKDDLEEYFDLEVNEQVGDFVDQMINEESNTND